MKFCSEGLRCMQRIQRKPQGQRKGKRSKVEGKSTESFLKYIDEKCLYPHVTKLVLLWLGSPETVKAALKKSIVTYHTDNTNRQRSEYWQVLWRRLHRFSMSNMKISFDHRNNFSMAWSESSEWVKNNYLVYGLHSNYHIIWRRVEVMNYGF